MKFFKIPALIKNSSVFAEGKLACENEPFLWNFGGQVCEKE